MKNHYIGVALAAGLFLLQSPAARATSQWTKISTPDFEFLTTAGAPLVAEAVGELESLRLYFRQAAPTFATTEARLRIVAFSSEWEFREFRTNSHSPAYFVGGPGQATVVLGRLAKDTMPALRHEYVHYLLRQSARPLPLWLEEGLAEHFSGVSAEAARSRARLLQRGGWIPLTSLIQAGRESQWYRQSEFAERFYAQSWALVDLLVKRAGGACGRQQMESWAAGDFGAPGELENELQRHVGSLRGRTPPAAAAAKVELAPAGDGEVALALACLKMQIGDLDGAGARLAAGPDSPAEAWALQGEIELRRGRKPDALQAFRRALRLGSGDRRALWNLVVLEQAESNGSAVPALERLLAVDPGFDEARLVLSSHYLQQRRYGDALAQLRSIRMAPPGKSGYMQQAMAVAESQSRAGGRGDR